MSPPVHHLLALWNPTYAEDALEEHLRVLLARVQEWRAQPGEDIDDPYVWWGLIRSSNRQAPLPHKEDLRRLAEAIEADPESERHLYLTDYRSLVVAELTEVVFEEPNDPARIPEYYRRNTYLCDCWFRLGDIRVLVRDDLPGVIRELRALKNTRYHDRPVSLYGGMVELPLVVRRDDDQEWFSEFEMAPLEGKFWVESDRERGSAVGRMMAELRDNILGARCWDALAPNTRTFLASAEATWRDRSQDAGHDFSGILIDLARAVEVQTNVALKRLLKTLPEKERLANVGGRTEDLLQFRSLTLGELAHVLGSEPTLGQAIANKKGDAEWFAVSWPPVVAQVAGYRNAAGHGGTERRKVAGALRARLLGIGCESDMVRLGRVG